MKDGFIKVATARPDVRVADCAYNLNACLDCAAEADRSGVKLLVYPELCLTGYTCGDLFLQDILPCEASEALRAVCRRDSRIRYGNCHRASGRARRKAV